MKAQLQFMKMGELFVLDQPELSENVSTNKCQYFKVKSGAILE